MCDSIVSTFESKTISCSKNPKADAVGDLLLRQYSREVFPTPSSTTQAGEAEVHNAGLWDWGLCEVATLPAEISSKG